MKRMLRTLVSGLWVWGMTAGLMGADLGDPAPPLKISEWVKGGPVDLAAGKGKTIYVIEFWATWCPPCRTSIPHLTEVQKQFKDKNVVIIGVSDEKAPVVQKFVKQMGDRMEYVVAIDDGRNTSQAYMEAFKQNGIPHAFIVDKDGRIVWHGHPMVNLDETLKEIVAGTYSLDTAKKRDQAKVLYQEFLELAGKDGNEARLDELGKQLAKVDADIGGINPGQKFDAAKARERARFQGALREYQMALFRKTPGTDVDALEAKVKQYAPEGFDLDEFKGNLKFQRAFTDYYRAATEGSSKEALAPLAKDLSALKTKNASMLNEVAWTLLTDEKIKERDLNLARSLAQAAYDASEGKDASIVDTYARALADTGSLPEAIRLQKEAVKLSDDAEQTATLKKTLADYEKRASAK